MGWRMRSDVSKLYLCLSSFSSPSVASPMSQLILQSFFCFSYITELILQAFHHFNYITAHFPTLPSLYLHHNSFSSPSLASPMSQLILQSFFCFSYITGSSLTSPGESPILSKNILHRSEEKYRLLFVITAISCYSLVTRGV